MDQLPVPSLDGLSPGWLLWLKDHGAGYVVAGLWIWTLLRERTTLRLQSEKLSERLCQVLESASAERARLSDEYRSGHDWIVNVLLQRFTELAVKLEHLATGTQQRPQPSPQPSAPPPPPPKPSRASSPSIQVSAEPPPLPPPPAPRAPTGGKRRTI